MKKLLLVMALLSLASAPLSAQTVYAAKFVCGKATSSLSTPFIFAPGAYYTTINVHAWKGTDFRKRFSVARPDERAGPLSQWFGGALRDGESLQIDCRNIYSHLNIPPGQLIDGFVEIVSPVELDVVGVYSGAPSSGQIATLHMERVPGRKP